MGSSYSNIFPSDWHQRNLINKRVTLGFDGFVDSIIKIIRKKEGDRKLFFTSSTGFAQYILEKQSKNFSIELEEQLSKMGGNMPITANALGTLGAECNCIGALGFPQLHKVYEVMSPNCKLYSFANPGLSMAYEFDDSKMMMADMQELNRVNWQVVVDVIGIQKIIDLFSHRHLLALLNWSELEHSTDIWKGLLNDVLPRLAYDEKPYGFFDLSDCSRRTDEKIYEALMLLNEFAKYWKVILSMNLNEAHLLHRVLTAREAPEETSSTGATLFEALKIHQIVIHTSARALSWSSEGMFVRESYRIEKPKVLTGAGDNFNAGFCAATLAGLQGEDALAIAHAVSGYYLLEGTSPDFQQLSSLVKEHI
jgi:hypothetical protein